MSKIKNFESRQEFERAFLPEWKVVELGETAKTFSEAKREYDEKILGYHFQYPVGTIPAFPSPNSPVSYKTIYRFG